MNERWHRTLAESAVLTYEPPPRPTGFFISKESGKTHLYLSTSGTWEDFCSAGWFDTEEAALEVYAHATEALAANRALEVSNEVLEDLHWEDRQV